MTENDMLLDIMQRFIDAAVCEGLADRIAYAVEGGYHGWRGAARNPLGRMSHQELVAAVSRRQVSRAVPALYSRETIS